MIGIVKKRLNFLSSYFIDMNDSNDVATDLIVEFNCSGMIQLENRNKASYFSFFPLSLFFVKKFHDR